VKVTNRTPARSRGFTLIELMIAIAVGVILVGLAVPSYLSHVQRSARTEAQAYLMSVAVRQQQFLLDTRAYAGTLGSVGVSPPARVQAAYNLTLNVTGGPPPGFSVVATPKGSQLSDGCGTLSIDQAGTKSAAKSGCW
jgi:type IV pilus assembly protein PilE